MQTQTHLKSFFTAVLLIAFISVGLNAAVKPKGETVTIQTSAICESCKKRIETTLSSTTGIESVNLNLKDKKLKVKYDPTEITPLQIRSIISNTGYDADDMKKNEEAFNKLPHCCQKPM